MTTKQPISTQQNKSEVAKPTDAQLRKQAMLKWLSHSEVNVFITVSLKQAISPFHDSEEIRRRWATLTNEQRKEIKRVVANGRWVPITPADVVRTAWLVRDRFTHEVFGKRKKRHHPFFVFAEGDSNTKRRHLHIIASRPLKMTIEEYEGVFWKATKSLDWVYDEMDFKPIPAGTGERFARYCLKEGLDAFIPEASFVPSPK